MQKLLTVVVPIYKVEKYINKCLDSLIVPEEQMKLLEVICVNDGTPDNSALMAKEYEKRYPETFKVIDKENGGHGSAWNKGVELATGKYIRFLDSDDWLTNFEEFIKKLLSVDTDLVFTNMVKYYQKTDSYKRFDVLGMSEGIVYDAEEFDWSFTNSMLCPDGVTNFQQCTYKTSMLKPYCPLFLEKQFYDDEILYVVPLILSKTITFFDMVLYNYYIGREGQTVDPKVYAKGYDFKLKVRNSMQKFVDAHKDISYTKNKKLEFILNRRNTLIMTIVTLMPYSEGKNKAKEFVEWLQQNHPNYVKSIRFRLYNISYGFYRLVSYIRKFLFKYE